MKRLICGMLTVVMCVITSCRNEYDPLDDGNYRIHSEKEKPVMKTVKMSFGGDFITESEEPLLRAEELHTYKAVNVYWTEDKEGASEEIYAYGLFVDTDEVKINLFTGYKYRFEATVLIDDRDIIQKLNGYYSYPFRKNQVGTDADEDFAPGDSDININKFHYAEDEKATKKTCYRFSDLTSGEAYVDIAGDRVGSTKPNRMRYPRVKRYYGEVENFDLSNDGTTVNIEMNYKSFGLKIVINKLPFGTLSVEDVTYDVSTEWQRNLLFPKDLIFNAPSVGEGEEVVPEAYQGLFSMHSMTADKATFTLKFTWNKGEGVEAKTFTRSVEVHPKMNRILNVDVTGTENTKGSGNIVFNNIQDETLNDEASNIYLNEDNPNNNNPVNNETTTR